MQAAKAQASLHICKGSPEPRHSNEISCAGSNGELCTVYVNSEYCGESAQANTTSVRCINASKILPVRCNKIPH